MTAASEPDDVGIDLRPLLPPLLQQHDRPLCLPLSISTTHAAVRAQQNAGNVTPLAPEALWQHAHSNGGTSPAGTDGPAMQTAMQQQGQPELDLWPFNVQLGYGTEPIPYEAGTPPWHAGTLVDVQIARDGREHHMERVLRSGRPVIIGVEVIDDFLNVGPDGHLPPPDPTARLGELHAVTIVGLTREADGSPVFIIANTWGPGWGAGGYAYLTASWLAMFAAVAWTVT